MINRVTYIYIEGKFDDMSGIFLIQSQGRNKNTISGIMLYFVGEYVSVYVHCYNTITKDNSYTKIGQAVFDVDNDAIRRIKLKTYCNKNGCASIDISQGESLKTLSWEGLPESIPPTSGGLLVISIEFAKRAK